VDGGLMSAFFTPPPLAYPLDSHVREFVGHLGYGAVTGTMLSGIIVWGGVGLLLDRWWGTRFVALIGVLLGLTVAIYLVVVKYGALPPTEGPGRTGSTRGRRRSPTRTQKGQR